MPPGRAFHSWSIPHFSLSAVSTGSAGVISWRTLSKVSHTGRWMLNEHCSSPPFRFPLLESLHDVMLQQQPGGFYCRGLLGTRCLPPWQVRYYNVTPQILFFGNANFTIMLDKCSEWILLAHAPLSHHGRCRELDQKSTLCFLLNWHTLTTSLSWD